jgi:hypothetical protein
MIRKIISIASAAVAVGALTLVPRVADAQVTVTATVASATTFAVTTDAATLTWTGAAVQAVPFSITVTSNDVAGYVFTFTGTNGAAGGPFELAGTGGNATLVAYTVTDATTTYTNGTAGADVFPAPTAAGGDLIPFNVHLPIQTNIQADTYGDTLIVAVTGQ